MPVSRKRYHTAQDHAPTPPNRAFDFDKYISQKPMTTPGSPSRSTPYRDGGFLKDLDQLKKLIQQTMEEYSACECGSQPTSREKTSIDKENTSNSGSMIEDFQKDLVEITQLAEERRVAEADGAASLGQLNRLRQALDDDHRRSLESISDTFQNLAEIQRMGQAEVLKVVRGRRGQPRSQTER
ncbi:hypothetical protein M413DRAFT_444135 [Hebeloma cylindrosporum]|uniref:Uncharacterized protein n=1 Tax=Hebeloma cylindrosporum TaxID=76867 RepID=A0A0C2YQM1_HEBCY|nr:hypothetical protein M413DRAFT_444135 [Hebeloma cylindrosporum h7]